MSATAVRESSALTAELDRQLGTLLAKGYPCLAGLSESAFLARLEPLRDRLPALASTPERLPFLVVVTGRLVRPHGAVPALELKGKTGFTSMEPEDLERFVPLPELELPDVDAYLLLDVETGVDTLNLTPNQALPLILGSGRSPLTVAEGLALVTHRPGMLRSHSCFSMLGSRCGDKRVTALWVSKGRPRLGWCFAGAPHTWLSSASCGGRVG